jgi:endonuclease-3
MSGRPKPEPPPEKKARARRIVKTLAKLYPEADCELTHGDPLQLLVATILSAQCTDQRVNLVTPALFAKYRSAVDYAGATPEEVEDLVRSTGFFRNKTKSIIGLGRALVERHAGKVPRTMDELTKLPGVGRKTANVLLGAWFKEPAIAVDTHVQRVAGRLELTRSTDPVTIERDLQRLLPEKDWTFTSIALIWHGRRICQARKPKCPECALRSDCPFPTHL